MLLKSDGMSWRPIVPIEDIGSAFVAAIEAPVETVHNEIFNVGITPRIIVFGKSRRS